MQVDAIYSHGRIEFVQPLRLKHDHIRLVVNVPDEEVETSQNPFGLTAEVLQNAAEMQRRIDAVRKAPLPADSELPDITAKQLERQKAYELRAQMRTEQGRPV